MTDNLPPSWAATTIGDIFEIVGGSTPRTDNPNYWDGDIPWLTPDDLSTHQGVLVSRGRRSITEEGFASTSTHMLPKDSILFSSRAPIGYTAVAANPLCTNQGFKSLIPPAGVGSRYVYWYLHHATPTIRELGSGTTFRELSKKRMNAVPFVLAPTAEQGRIVAAIEEHFSRLDAVESTLRKALRQLHILRSTILVEAFNSNRGWLAHSNWTTIGDIAEVRGGIQKQPKRRPNKNPAPFLRVANVLRGELLLDEVHHIELFDGELERYRLQVGDLLVVEGNGSPQQIGRAASWVDEIADCVHQNHLIRVRPGAGLDPGYLALYWNAPHTASVLRDVASSTSGLYTLSTAKVKSIPIPLAPLAEQRHIAEELDQHLEKHSSLEQSIRRALDRLRAVRRSVLAVAFSGQLVPQDPQDEAASVLLERIAASRSTKPNRRASTRQVS